MELFIVRSLPLVVWVTVSIKKSQLEDSRVLIAVDGHFFLYLQEFLNLEDLDHDREYLQLLVCALLKLENLLVS